MRDGGFMPELLILAYDWKIFFINTVLAEQEELVLYIIIKFRS
jgi:hypothetical protein